MEKNIKNNKATVQKAIESVHKEILPECRDTFQEIKQAQANLVGKVDAILVLVQKIANGGRGKG